jgi:cardiolipin synthase
MTMSAKEYRSNNRVTLIKSGKEYFNRLIELIHSSQSIIHIQTYIFQEDETGKKVSNSLIGAAKRGVKVFILTDGYASKSISKSFKKKLTDAGIYFRFFRPFWSSNLFYFTRRLHHKIIVIDKQTGIVGGLNIADRYNDTDKSKAWLDFAVIIEGETATELNQLCNNMWEGDSYETKGNITKSETSSMYVPENEKSDIRIRLNDWIWHKNEISATYIEMFRTAKKQVTILCSYFIPGMFIRRQMLRAIKRGVKIIVVAAGPSDVWLAKNAERWLYDWLIRNKIEIYEYQKNVLHGKIAVCDGNLVTVGSYNINNLSAYASIELNVDIKNEYFARQVEETIKQIIEKECIKITHEHHKQTKNNFKQFARWLSYQFIYVIFKLLTISFKRKI